MTQFATFFFGLCLIASTALNVAFTLAPETMTHMLQVITAT